MKFYDNILKLFHREDNVGQVVSVNGGGNEALLRSYSLYRSEVSGGGLSLGLASGIVSEISRLTLTEFEICYGSRPCDNALRDALFGLAGRMRSVVELACATGGVMLKPCYNGSRLSVSVFLPFDFVPLGRDCAGSIDECAFIFRQKCGGKDYIRVEEHRRKGNGYLITNRAFLSQGNLSPCPLSAVPDWKGISESCTIENLEHPLFSYFAVPGGDPSDPSSPLGVPVFRRAEGLIREADKQLERLIWEFEGGELAIDASEDAFRVGKDGNPRLPVGKERLYRTNALDACCSTNELMKVFSPELRDRSLINGLNRLVMFVEDACGIARGTFSDPSEVAKTATEVRASRQRTYSTVRAIQRALEEAFTRLVSALNDTAVLYGLWVGEAKATVTMGDGVLNDSESVKASQREDVKYGILTADEFKARWYSDKKQGGIF